MLIVDVFWIKGELLIMGRGVFGGYISKKVGYLLDGGLYLYVYVCVEDKLCIIMVINVCCFYLNG